MADGAVMVDTSGGAEGRGPVYVDGDDDGLRYVWVSPPGSNRRADTVSAVGRFRVDLRHGLGKTVPTDRGRWVSANLFNGNMVVSAASPSMTTVGGDVGVGFTYNSAKNRPSRVCVGSYFDGLGNRDFPAGEAPELVRTDAQVTFYRRAGSPYPPAIAADGFRVRWSGYLTAPATGSDEFGVTRDDGVRIVVDGTMVSDQWSGAAIADQFGTAKQLAAGVAVPLVVEYYENGGGAQIAAEGPPGRGRGTRTRLLAVPGFAAVADRLGAVADIDGDGGYLGARVTDAAVVPTDSSGSTRTYTRSSDGSFAPPVGEHGILAKDATGTLTSPTRTDGPTRSTPRARSPALRPRPMTANGLGGIHVGRQPAGLATITDPASGRTIGMRYQGREQLPEPPRSTPVSRTTRSRHRECSVSWIYPDGPIRVGASTCRASWPASWTRVGRSPSSGMPTGG